MTSFAVPTPRETQILSVGAYRPRRVVTNDEICERIDSNDEWIVSRSGIRTRRFADEEETVIEMSRRAAADAIAGAGLVAEQIDCVVLATSTHHSQTPAAAPIVAHALGISGGAFDVSAGCAGFCYALATASDMVKAGSATHVLVIGVEKLSDAIDPTDRSTAFIFGDGAGAVVVGPSEESRIGPVVWGSDGSQSQLIRQTPQLWTALRDDPDSAFPVITMDGPRVFRWAAFEMGKVATAALDRAGLGVDDLDAFVPHQANLRIIEVLAKGLRLPESTAVAHDIESSGNTSAASVPLAMHAMLESGEAEPGGTALLMAFGAGLVYAAQVVRLPAAS